WVNTVLDELTAEATSVARQGSDGELLTERKAFMRYQGQGWEIPVELPAGTLGGDGAQQLTALFDAEYARLFGRPLVGLEIEVMNWSVRVVSRVSPPQPATAMTTGSAVESAMRRRLYDAGREQFCEAAVVERDTLAAGQRVAGPA